MDVCVRGLDVGVEQLEVGHCERCGSSTADLQYLERPRNDQVVLTDPLPLGKVELQVCFVA